MASWWIGPCAPTPSRGDCALCGLPHLPIVEPKPPETFEAGARLQGWPLDELTAQAESVGPVTLYRPAAQVSEPAASKAPNPSET